MQSRLRISVFHVEIDFDEIVIVVVEGLRYVKGSSSAKHFPLFIDKLAM